MNDIGSNVHHGFLLTRSSKDKKGVPEIEYWVATKSGPTLLKVQGERPALFVSVSSLDATREAIADLQGSYEIKQLDLMNFDRQRVAVIYSPSIRASFQLQERLKYTGIEMLEADFRLHDRYLMERFAYAGITFTGQFIKRNGYTEAVSYTHLTLPTIYSV